MCFLKFFLLIILCFIFVFRDNPAQTFRLHPFILRDIGAIRSVELREGLAVRPQLFITDANLTTMIMQTVSRYNIRDLFIVNLLRPYIGNYTTHFIHELYNYARSPYDLIGYDRNVQYSMRPYITPSFYHAFNISDVYDEIPRPITPLRISPSPRLFSETIVLDTDDEEIGTNSRLFGQEIIIVSSTNEEDSDVEILSHSYLPRRTLDSSRDQPSTSTGIRHSLDRPNNR